MSHATKQIGVVLAVLAGVALSCQPAHGEVAVEVTGSVRQPIDGWGTSVVTDTRVEPLISPGLSGRSLRRLDRAVFRSAGINLVRVFGPGHGSERGRVGPPRADDPRFAFMRRVRRYGVRFMLTGSDAPPAMKQGIALAAGRERDYAAYLVSVARLAERLGVPFSWVAAANEPDHPASLLTLSSAQAAGVYANLAKLLPARGLGARLALGDDIGWPQTVSYARAQLQSQPVRRRAAVLASHAYRGNDGNRAEVARLAGQEGLAFWQTEWTTGCSTCPDDRTMKIGLTYAQHIAADLAAGARAWFAFRAVSDTSHGPIAGLVVRTRGGARPFRLTKRFQVFRQYSSAAPGGSRRLAVTGSIDSVPVLAFRKRRRLAVVLTNAGTGSVSVRLDLGRRRGLVSTRRTSENEDFRRLGPRSYQGSPLALALPGRSVTTVFLALRR
jgi:O-glycosyl hydrolase